MPLDKALEDIEITWTEDQLEEFANKPDSSAVRDVHFGYGMYFRNKTLRNPKDSTLLKYFNSLGIYHEDHISNIVFTSLHRKLNNKSIDLDSQLKLIKAVIAKSKALNDKNVKRAFKYYDKYKTGDTILVRMPVNSNNNATQYSYPENSGWIYNDSIDLLIKGLITSKPELKDTSDMSIKLKILSMNREGVKVLMRDVSVGDEIESDFKLDIIEDIR
ncbi:DUF6794 domain-containing protein [Aquimarina sp. MMG016]|uniref:DUF6794 domain-containing protein n=1 Tax=Aquimarina sp. MMG016 TaxID=2822690 RepID=UPI001B3A4818|nr:DUF6794 domain-containing protein [Aquimarina sp. MMG016]